MKVDALIKNCKKLFLVEHDHFREREPLAKKISINFFIGKKVLNIFYIAIFSKKTIFSKITAKKNFWEAYPISREWGVGRQK